jgi:hypothetical protein
MMAKVKVSIASLKDDQEISQTKEQKDRDRESWGRKNKRNSSNS